MKENSGGLPDVTMAGQEGFNLTPVVCIPRLSRHHVQLACKENISEYNESFSQSVVVNSVPRRPMKQQQLQQFFQPNMCHQPQTQQLEVNRDYTSDAILDGAIPKHVGPVERRNHVNGQGHFLPPSHRQQQQHQSSLRLRFSQLISHETPDPVNVSPLPHLPWAQSDDLWKTMRSKDVSKAAPEAELRLRHPEILPSMRVILLDWMMEVGVAILCCWLKVAL